MSTQRWDTIVVGAGVMGAWTAWHLRRQGERVLLLDAWGPAHARASSGGESRITRTAYGRDEVYTRMAWESLDDWRWLSTRTGLPVFHPIGVLFFFQRPEPYVTQTLEVHRRLNLPTEALDRAELVKRFPQVNWAGIEIGLYERELGALMARRAVQTLVAEFVKAGGAYATAAIMPPAPAPRLEALACGDGQRRAADKFVFACGPWLPKLFPDLLGARIFPTRQEVFFFAPEAGDARFQPPALPVWADFNDGDIYYGMPDLEARGFKIAHDQHGAPIDPDSGDRIASAEGLADVRQFLRLRFPALASRPLVEARVCQYENSSNGDLLVDRHPAWNNTWLVGAGSGHAFKHGPAIGRLAASLVTGALETTEPRFSLATKATAQDRAVH
ncbi:MAG TPA: FAD-dependent oxidoreductase [Steroidobacteraceae bacterium]|nr:FAD-dependent oxidoreductase [Steroidobacteraceae bacterium]